MELTTMLGAHQLLVVLLALLVVVVVSLLE